MAKGQPTKPYSTAFYDEALITALRSAQQIVPLVLDLVQVKSVVDLGCGPAAWLSTFKAAGVPVVLGVDFTEVDSSVLQISPNEFLKHDLTKLLSLEAKFDLAISLEVCEHLPASAADNLVDSLCRLAPVVLFSAAIPFQGGTNHINEQWPEYWAEKFRNHDYQVIDCLREKIWRNEEVAYWYAQNILLFVHRSELENNEKLIGFAKATNPNYLSLIHPKTYLKSREALSDPKYILMRIIWNLLPRNIRIRLVGLFGQNFWCQVNTNYSAVQNNREK